MGQPEAPRNLRHSFEFALAEFLKEKDPKPAAMDAFDMTMRDRGPDQRQAAAAATHLRNTFDVIDDGFIEEAVERALDLLDSLSWANYAVGGTDLRVLVGPDGEHAVVGEHGRDVVRFPLNGAAHLAGVLSETFARHDTREVPG